MRAYRFRTSDIELAPKVATVGTLSEWSASAGRRMVILMIMTYGAARRLFVRPLRSFHYRKEAEQVRDFAAGQHLQGRYFRGGPRY